MNNNKKRLAKFEAVLSKQALINKATIANKGQLALNPEDFLSAGPDYEDAAYDLTNMKLSTKAIAYYLPQFYTFPENDQWWGKGFTEWRNVTRGRPRFDNHYQPHLPLDLGYYDLRNAEIMALQAQMARKAGLHGWCFYYYRFGDKRLLDKPINNFLDQSSIDMNFCLMWANEEWSRAWDGKSNDVLISQNYDPKFDNETIDDLARHFNDPRYMRVDDKPLFYIYHPAHIPDAKRKIEIWRDTFWKRHSLEINFHMAQTFGDKDPRPYGLDGAIEFPPHKLVKMSHVITDQMKNVQKDFTGTVIDYDSIVKNSLKLEHPDYDLVKCVTPNWDNDARRPNRGYTIQGSKPSTYQAWLEGVIDYAGNHPVQGEKIVCVNAWNEWAEGAHLEPDVHYGSAYLNATARALLASESN